MDRVARSNVLVIRGSEPADEAGHPSLGHPDPGAVIRYTPDGIAPSKASTVYRQPLELAAATAVGARAREPGHARSVAHVW